MPTTNSPTLTRSEVSTLGSERGFHTCSFASASILPCEKVSIRAKTKTSVPKVWKRPPTSPPTVASGLSSMPRPMPTFTAIPKTHTPVNTNSTMVVTMRKVG